MVKVSGMRGWSQAEGGVCWSSIPTLQDPRHPPCSPGPARAPAPIIVSRGLGHSCHPPRGTARTGCLLLYITATEITRMRSPGAGDDIQHSAKSRPSSPAQRCHWCPAARQLLCAPLLWLQRGWTAGDCVWLKMCGEKGGMDMNSAPNDAAGTHHVLPREQRKQQGHRNTKAALPAFCASSLPAVAVSLHPPAI